MTGVGHYHSATALPPEMATCRRSASLRWCISVLGQNADKVLEVELAKQEVADIRPKSDNSSEAFLGQLGSVGIMAEYRRAGITVLDAHAAHMQ